jgi:hypothetical protein
MRGTSAPWIRAPRVGATDQGADPLATSDATFAHAGEELYHLGAVIHDTVTCKRGAAIHDAEVRVHFLKSFQKRRICENFFKKGQKNPKKPGAEHGNKAVKGADLYTEHGFAIHDIWLKLCIHSKQRKIGVVLEGIKNDATEMLVERLVGKQDNTSM